MSHDVVSTSWEQELRSLIASIPEQEDWPYIWYDEMSDRLTVILRRNDNQSVTRQNILPGVDVLLLSYPQPQEGSFAGIEFSQGVRMFVERFYQESFGDNYATYRIRHNKKRILTTIASIFRAVLNTHEPTTLPVPFLDRINQMLVEESHLEIHIPL